MYARNIMCIKERGFKMPKVNTKTLRKLIGEAERMPYSNLTKSLLIGAIIESADYIDELENKIKELEKKSESDDKHISMMAKRLKAFEDKFIFNK